MAEDSTDNIDTKAAKNKNEESGQTPKKELKLVDLKVAELKTELENRGLDKAGVKASLVERLRNALEEEGHDADEFVFELSNEAAASKKSKKSEEVTNESKVESDGEVYEVDSEGDNEDRQENSSEILQLSLDDKESNLDSKENMDTHEKSDNENEDESKMDTSESESKKEDNEVTKEEEGEDSATKNDESESPDTPKKSGAKNAVKVISRSSKGKFATPPRSIWITSLSPTTRAANLKSLFTKYGRVLLVKIVTNAKQVSGEKKFYGFITMGSNKDALHAIEVLNGTDLNGQKLEMELTQNQPNALLKKTTRTVQKKAKPDVSKTSQRVKKDSSEGKDSKDKDEDTESKGSREDRPRYGRSRDHDRRPREYFNRDYSRGGNFRRPYNFRGRGRGRGGGGYPYRERPPVEQFRRPFGRKPFYGRMNFRPPMKPNFMPYPRMREDRPRERFSFREREFRESERRRAQEAFRHKLIERKQRDEAYRLEREKVQLRIEREMLERERAEILKLEREKQRMERERLEREREKLRRQVQMRETTSIKRPFARPGEGDPLWEKEKRARHYESRYPSYEKQSMESRPDYREGPSNYGRPKYEQRPSHYEREAHQPSASHSDFGKYKEKPEAHMREHEDRRVYKRPYFKEEAGRSYPPREVERYPQPPDERNFRRKIHETMRSPRSRGRRMSYY